MAKTKPNNKSNKNGGSLKGNKNNKNKGNKGGKTQVNTLINNYASNAKIDSVPKDTEVPGVLKTDLSGIFGIPYQFMSSVDQRIEGTSIGSKYAEKIVSRLPLLFLTPCKQKFMAEFMDSDKENVLNDLISGDGSSTNVGTTGKYYTTEFAYPKYYSYVNKMMTSLCYYTGLGDKKVGIDGNKKLKNVNWENATNSSFKNYFNAKHAVTFYLDGLVSMSESFSNSTTESSLASTINGFSDQANELRFLLGEKSALGNMMKEAGNVGNTISNVVGKFSDLTGGMLTDLASTGVSTVLSGGKIIFPKLWQSSDFSRSYSFDLKFRSPDHDTLSILLNVLAPYVHILGLVLPQNMDSKTPNGYTTPFLVKAYCKGMFNIDMGIITDLSVTRGGECQWNDDGLPTQIDVSITIEDLYSNIFMTDSKFSLAVVQNTAMQDFLANLAGLNLAETEFARSIKMLVYQNTSTLNRLPSTLWNKFDNAVANVMSNMFKKINF